MATGQIIYDLVDLAELTQYSRQFDNEVLRPDARFVLGQFMPDLMIEDLEFKIRKNALQDVDIAEYRAWDTPAPMTARPGITRIRGELAPISRGIPLGEEETLRKRSLERDNNNPIISAIFEDTERMTRSVRARVEMAIGDVINDGKVTIAENGLAVEADFGRTGAMSVTASVLWTDAVNAKPVTDLLGWIQAYNDQNGSLPGSVLIPQARINNLFLNAELRALAASNGTTPNRINRRVINEILSEFDIPPFVIYDGQFRKDGTRTRVLPANKIFLMPPADEPLGNVFWGETAESLVLRGKGLIEAEEAPGLVTVVLFQDHPVQTTTISTAVALPVMPNPNLILDAVVS